MAKKKTCVIVGAGAGGLGCGAILAKNEVKPIIFERGRIIGGAARTLDVDGYSLDEGAHFLVDIPGTTAHRDTIGQILGIKTEVAHMKGPPVCVIRQGEEIAFTKLWPLSADYDKVTLKKVFKYLSDADIAQIESFAGVMMEDLNNTIASVNPQSFDDLILKLPYVPIQEWVLQRTKSKNVLTWLLDLGSIVILVPPESVATCSTYSVLALVMGLTTGMFSFVYPVHPKYGGLGALLEPYADYIREHGGEIHTNTAVKKIKVEGGKAKGVIVDRDGKEEFVAADAVVCNVPPQLAYRTGILDLDSFPNAYKEDFLQKVKTIEEGAKRYEVQTLNVHVALKKKLTDSDSCHLFIDNEGHSRAGMQIYTNYGTNSAPAGKQLLYLYAFLYKAPRDFAVAEKHLTGIILPALRAWLKDFDKNVDWIMTSFSPVPYAQLNQQMFSSSEKFDVKTGAKNLYFAGMYAGLVGADGAMVIGVRAAEQILDRKIL